MKDALKELLYLPELEKERRGLLHTPAEIRGQAELWESTCTIVKEKHERIREFLGEFLRAEKKRVLCSGSGTSEFIGYCIEGLLRRHLEIPVNVVSSSSLVTNPENIYLKDYRTLLVSFARSGNSPESLGAVEIADMTSKKLWHLVVTCNEGGALAKWAQGAGSADRPTAAKDGAGSPEGARNVLTLCLDGRTDDRGLAMTASFTNMVVAGQLLAHTFDFAGCESRVEKMIDAGEILLERAPDVAQEICALDFHRAVFLGSGSHYGTAIESHLKLQELTAGKVMCGFDTFMGLRHGPEALIDGRTLVVAYVSKDPYRRKYEGDLLKELREKRLGMRTAVCGPALDERMRSLADFSIDFDPGGTLGVDDEHAPPVAVIFGQLLGLFKSVGAGLKPDAPSEAGIINRVVKGVKIYNPLEHRKTGRFEIIAGE
jgi:tagatose-6-phosphate ketose/aldose isomerase